MTKEGPGAGGALSASRDIWHDIPPPLSATDKAETSNNIIDPTYNTAVLTVRMEIRSFTYYLISLIL